MKKSVEQSALFFFVLLGIPVGVAGARRRRVQR